MKVIPDIFTIDFVILGTFFALEFRAFNISDLEKFCSIELKEEFL